MHEEVIIVNCSKAVITGKKQDILGKYKEKIARGVPAYGPFFPRPSEKIVRRTVRGMIPWRQARGKEVFKYVKCYRGIPEALKNKEFQTVKGADVSKMRSLKYITIGDISKQLGAE